ncbi:MAG: excinuclease ABC subunit UvrC, partial [Acidimicrobiia bacterium]|nr:excinuclease ABC subunit UvrC [Acidimicrobiia bacterium]
VDRLRAEMADVASRQEYEAAARLRDQATAVEKALARQELVSDRPETFDLVALEEDDLEAVLVVLTVVKGRVTGRRTIVLDKVEDLTTSELMGVLLGRLYESDTPPRQVLVSVLPGDLELWEQALGQMRGSAVTVRRPQRGAKRRLMETAMANAAEEFARHRLRRSSDHNARARALRNLQEHLDLDVAPLRIECYDISTIQGRDTVGSMVVFEDALPKLGDYRRFKVRSVEGQDDFAAMEEVLRRRFIALLASRDAPQSDRGRFAYEPSLVVIDGGVGQLGRAVRVLAELELDIPVVGLAKRLEEVYLPGVADPVVIPRGEDALYLLQRVRDEAHRFAVAYHRTLRARRMTRSILDDVPGVGPTRKRSLMRRFGSIKRMREAGEQDLAEVVPTAVAGEVYRVLHNGSADR